MCISFGIKEFKVFFFENVNFGGWFYMLLNRCVIVFWYVFFSKEILIKGSIVKIVVYVWGLCLGSCKYFWLSFIKKRIEWVKGILICVFV